MIYEDLEEAREQRAAKEAAEEAKKAGKEARKAKKEAKTATNAVLAEGATADKGERSRKRKMSEALEPTRVSMAPLSEFHNGENEMAPRPWRAPVARMW